MVLLSCIILYGEVFMLFALIDINGVNKIIIDMSLSKMQYKFNDHKVESEKN